MTVALDRHDGSQPLVRTYSLSAAPSERRWRISVKREPHGQASQLLHDTIKAGDEVRIGAPRGRFVLPADDLPLVFIGAGIGVTPLLAMLGELANARDPREVWWIYSTRSAHTTPHAEETAKLLETLGARMRVYHTRPDDLPEPSLPSRINGRLSPEQLPALGVPREARFILCGPERFMDEMSAGLVTWGVTPEHIHRESFAPARASAAATAPRLPSAGEAGANVAFARSGLTARWEPRRYGSLLELAEASDVPVTWSCRTGVCHLCESGLVSGSVTYEPAPLDPPADGNVLLCCSVPAGELVLDL